MSAVALAARSSTDKHEGILTALESAKEANDLNNVHISYMSWSGKLPAEVDFEDKIDLVLADDCCYSLSATNSFLVAIEKLATKTPNVKIILAIEEHASSPECLDTIAKRGWRIQEPIKIQSSLAESWIIFAFS